MDPDPVRLLQSQEREGRNAQNTNTLSGVLVGFLSSAASPWPENNLIGL